jgi:5-oxoprolinase (ATP-hydrolysing) subunit A
VHGDSAGAVAMARTVREALTKAGIAIAPFLPRPA